MRPDALRARRRTDVYETADRVRKLLDEARHGRPHRTAATPGWADGLVAEIRADRDAHRP